MSSAPPHGTSQRKERVFWAVSSLPLVGATIENHMVQGWLPGGRWPEDIGTTGFLRNSMVPTSKWIYC